MLTYVIECREGEDSYEIDINIGKLMGERVYRADGQIEDVRGCIFDLTHVLLGMIRYGHEDGQFKDHEALTLVVKTLEQGIFENKVAIDNVHDNH